MSWIPTEFDLVRRSGAHFRFPLTHVQLEAYAQSTKAPNFREAFTAQMNDGEPVGHVEISHIWPYLSSRLSRVLVAPDKRSQGFGRSMISQALVRDFDVHQSSHVDLGVAADNSVAIACDERLKFETIGIWPRAVAVRPRAIDMQWMTLTRSQWLLVT